MQGPVAHQGAGVGKQGGEAALLRGGEPQAATMHEKLAPAAAHRPPLPLPLRKR